MSKLLYVFIVQPRGGVEEGPTVLRKAGLLEKLKELGNCLLNQFFLLKYSWCTILYVTYLYNIVIHNFKGYTPFMVIVNILMHIILQL